jgi:DNA-binding winged helix-turn-helix (wHTH) protein
MSDDEPSLAIAPARKGPLRGCWRFGEAVFEESSQTLRVRGLVVDVPRKSLEVLKQLLDHAGEVVTKDELAETCWPRRTVTDAVLATTVSRLRSALGDETLIQTVKGYGYRFVATASYEGPEPPVSHRLQLVPGDFVQGRSDWRLLEPFAGGNQADVWLAMHSDGPAQNGPANRVFKFASDSRGVVALKREVAINRLLRAVAGESGPFAAVLDWEFDHRPAFIAMPHVEGGNLQQWFYRVGGQETLSLDQRIDLAAQCAEAVAVAHSAGILHKDLKPANLLVDETGTHPRLYLADFGSGTVMDRERLRQFALTRMGLTQIAAATSSGNGTPMYMAPEVLGGEPCSERSDIMRWGSCSTSS